MPAGISNEGGKDLFAYNRQNGHPWHSLGQPFDRYMTIEEALELSGSDDLVIPVTLYAQTDDAMIEVTDTIGMWSNKHGLIATGMSPGYVPTQRREIAEIAYQIVGLAGDSAHIDTMGNLGEHANRFFTYIKVPDMVIDPNGIADTIERGVVAATSFDGSLRNLIFYSDIRVVCGNTLAFAMGKAKKMISVKHTRNSEAKIKEAALALEYLGAREEEITAKAEAMLRVDGDKALTRVLDNLWPTDDKDLDAKARTRRENEKLQVRFLYEGSDNLNVNLVGRTGWAAYNATVEYLDHFRGVRSSKDEKKVRAAAAVFPGSIVDQKVRVAELVLA
jgi:phage/plasmid-like protein (TIGR03299 family)